MYSTLSRCLRITRFEHWTTYWRRRMSPTERGAFTKHSSRIPSRIFGSGSTPMRPCHEAPSPQLYSRNENGNVCDRTVSLASNYGEPVGQQLRGSTDKKMSTKLNDKVALITGG